MNAAPQPVIETLGLVKDFGKTRALDGLNLSVAAGEVHGFLGPTVPANPLP
jgi:ABC-2 type transport system ATP-binding protein